MVQETEYYKYENSCERASERTNEAFLCNMRSERGHGEERGKKRKTKDKDRELSEQLGGVEARCREDLNYWTRRVRDEDGMERRG